MGRKSRSKHEKRLKKTQARTSAEPPVAVVTEQTHISVDNIGRWVMLPDGRTFRVSYVTEAGMDMTGVFTAARRRLTQADMSVLASVGAGTEGFMWEVGLRDPPVLRRPPSRITKYQVRTQEEIMTMMQQRQNRWRENAEKLQDARNNRSHALRQHHEDVSIFYCYN